MHRTGKVNMFFSFDIIQSVFFYVNFKQLFLSIKSKERFLYP